jgi:transposase
MAAKAQVEQPGRPGRRPSLNANHTETLRAITQEQPRSSLDEVTRELFRRVGVKVSTVTVRKALREAGIERLKPLRRAGERAAVQGSAPTRYGYTAAHRRADGPSGMNTDLTDAEWALVADLFERDGQRGAPPRFERRHMVNACCYALRTGCAWRLLPKTFPPWQATYKSFSRWAAANVFEAMHDRLRQQWRDRMGRAPDPTAAIQSTRRARAAPRRAATPGSTQARRSKAASATSSSTPWACCWPSRSPQPAYKIATRQLKS